MPQHPHRAAGLLIVLLLCVSAILAQQLVGTPPSEIDPNDPIARIKDEGLKRSQVMETMRHLTDVIGPRLTASPNMKRANDWTRDQLTKWGLQNSHLEEWGPFGRGWELKSFSAEVIAPQATPLIAFPSAWSPAVNIPSGEVVHLSVTGEADLARYKGQLRGKIVMFGNMRPVNVRFSPLATRLSEKELLDMADSGTAGSGDFLKDLQTPDYQNSVKARAFRSRQLQFIRDEGAALIVFGSAYDGGALTVEETIIPANLDTSSSLATLRSIYFAPRAYSANADTVTPQMVIAREQYNRLARLIKDGEKVRMKVSIDAQFSKGELMAYNTIAEIPGTDKADEVVIVGAHLDSWHAGTGATDNASGVAVAMEAVRIIQALGLKPRRTIRVGLWSGEEQGLYGSAAHVAKYFGKPVGDTQDSIYLRAIQGGMASKFTRGPAYDKFSAYYNLDNGTGKIRGVYLQGNEAVRPIFRQWLQPFRDLGASTLTAQDTIGTDHMSFEAIGLPGFQFIQDDIEYSTRTYHSNQDLFDRAQLDDLKQAATIMAAFAYNTAMLDQRLPRKRVPGE